MVYNAGQMQRIRCENAMEAGAALGDQAVSWLAFSLAQGWEGDVDGGCGTTNDDKTTGRMGGGEGWIDC